jgi:ribosomal protein L14E/L6E/L27E
VKDFSLKYGKVVIMTCGKYAGKKAIVIKVYEEGSKVIMANSAYLNLFRIRSLVIAL